MDFLFHSPLLFVCLGLWLLPRLLRLGRAKLATAQSQGTLPYIAAFMLLVILVVALVNGA